MNKPSSNILIRISGNSLSFATDKGDETGVVFEAYPVKNGVSMAANLREAFKTSPLLSEQYTRATVLVDSNTLLIPLEDYEEEEIAELYRFVYPSNDGCVIEHCVLPAFKNACAFQLNKDLKMVLTEHFEEVRLIPLMSRMWEFLLQRSINGNNKKLFAYFHDGKMEVCSFTRNRFTFVNTFEVQDMHDALYFLLGVWQQTCCKALTDDVFFVGNIPNRDAFTAEAKKFLRRIYYINPSADFNRAPVTQILPMPFDMMLMFL